MMKFIVIVLAALVVLGCAPSSTSTQPAEPKPNSQGSPRSLSTFSKLSHGMSVEQIVAIVGHPDRNTGGITFSGQYDLPDGTQVHVLALHAPVGDQKGLISVKHVKNKTTGESLELLKGNSEQKD